MDEGIYYYLEENIIRLNEAEASIDAALNKRFDLLKKSIEFIDKEKEINKFISVCKENEQNPSKIVSF